MLLKVLTDGAFAVGFGVASIALRVRRGDRRRMWFSTALVYAAMRSRASGGGQGSLEQPFATLRDVVFSGWFGPIGLSAVYDATTACRHLGDPAIWPITSLMVFGAIRVHRLTAAIGTR